MSRLLFTHGSIVLEDRVLEHGAVEVEGSRIVAVHPTGVSRFDGTVVNLAGRTLVPGFVDLHVHGGANADFMDGTEEAFHTVCHAHARHGTTSLLPTTTVARHDQHLTFLELCRSLKAQTLDGAAILGAHFYGPYFQAEARGCHPGAEVRSPRVEEYREYLDFADCIATATVAPELDGAETFVRDCRAHGIVCNAGHSYATYENVARAVEWGVRHVDHLFCAMSDRARLRQEQTYPMRGGLMEATLFFDELTTEIIADGKHLSPELLRLAYKCKGPDRLALVTDCNRALDMPDGEYLFGPLDGGEPILRKDGVGVMPNGQSLASGVVGMDHCLRTFLQSTGTPLVEAVRMATLTPARIAGFAHEVGSIAPGKWADLVVLDADLQVTEVYLRGKRFSLE